MMTNSDIHDLITERNELKAALSNLLDAVKREGFFSFADYNEAVDAAREIMERCE